MIGQVVVLVIFLAGATIGGLDTFGALTAHPAIAESIPKLSLLLISLLGSTVLIEHWASITAIQRDSAAAAKAAADISATLSNVEQLTHPTKLITNRRTHYLSFLQALDDAPPHSVMNVTHFEKLMGSPYNRGENELEEQFVKAWERKVLNGDIEVRQIVHVSSMHDLREVEQRLSQFGSCLNYSLNVVHGPSTFPYLDLVAIPGYWAALDLSADAVEPYRAANALEFRDVHIIEALTRYFDIWWGKFSTPVKGKDGVHRDVLNRLSCLLPEVEKRGFSNHQEIVFVAQKEPRANDLLTAMTEATTRLHIPTINKIYRADLDKAMSVATDSLRLICEQSKVIERTLVESFLIEAFTYATSEIVAVSYAKQQELFWQSPFGERFLQVNIDAAERISLRRVFLLTEEQHKMESIYTLLKKQSRSGVDVFYAQVSEVEAFLVRDFLIVDSSVAFELVENNGHDPLKDGTIYPASAEVEKYTKMFHNLLFKCHKFDEGRRKL